MLEQSCNHSQQCCNAVLRKQSSLRTVSYNITFTCCVRLHTPCCMLSRVLIVRNCCIRSHTTATTDATTPNIVGSTLSKYIKSVVGTLHLPLRTVKHYGRLIFKLWRTVAIGVWRVLKQKGGKATTTASATRAKLNTFRFVRNNIVSHKVNSYATSFPGFSPTRPYGATERERVGERSWERGWIFT